MSQENNFVKKIGRILYVDPNDVFGNINGVPITPDYSDMSISFKLECQVVPRYKKNVAIATTDVKRTDKTTKQTVTTKYQLNWNTPYGTVGENNFVSFLQGELYNDGKDNSLTTYYTDISYDDYAKQTIVEGLGVENLTVQYENYYTPTITIKFIDHRGASLFGREEVTHYDDKITIDSIFGAFFTAPYPRFRLQIKGFYGRAVTYQMTCSGFKGALNSQTGNFEATATFIGYSYSLLTDIPFEYLVATPYCEYFGKDYWEEKKTQEEWRMEGSFEGDEVPTFYELAQKIEAAFTNEDLLQVISEEDKKILEESNEKLRLLEDLRTTLVNLDGLVASKLCPNKEETLILNAFTQDTGENTLRLYNTVESIPETWETVKAVTNSMKEFVIAFNKAFEDDPIPEDSLPKLPTAPIKTTKLFNTDTETNQITVIGVPDLSVDNLSKLKINDIEVGEYLSKEIINFVNNHKSVGSYVYLIDWGTIEDIVENKISDTKTNVSDINNQKERNYIDLAINTIGMVPYVGNFFKLIMCHIETFIFMMNNCYLNIDNAARENQRTPEYLNLPYENTDVAPAINNNGNIPPWPLITKTKDDTNYYLMVEKDDTYGWVGDFSPYFEEAKLVRALYLACKRTSKEPKKDEITKPVEFKYFPIIPNDLNNNLNPFSGGGKTLSSMAGMIGLRAAQIFGIGEAGRIDEDIAKLIGTVDALNYYRFLGNKTELGEILEQQKDNLANTLYDIMLCKPSADKIGTTEDGDTTPHHDFEFAKGMFPQLLTGQMKNRHPIYVEDSNGLMHYAYLHTKSRYGLIPSNTVNWPKYGEIFTMIGDGTNGTYFEYKVRDNKGKLVGDSFLHLCSTNQLFSDYSTPDDKTKYVNNEMYYIATNSSLVEGILKRYKEMKSGSITIFGEKYEIDLSKVLDRYWTVEEELRYRYHDNANQFLTLSYADNKIEDKELLIGNGPDNSVNPGAVYDKLLGSEFKYASFESDSPKIDSEKVEVSKLQVTDFNYCWGGDKFYSLFGVDFYYLQNQIMDNSIRTRVKALLFLQSLPYNKDRTMSWDFSTSDVNYAHHMIRRVPFGFAALYGGLLWRHNYIVQNGVDPIQYKDSGGVSYVPAYEKGKGEYTLFEVTKSGRWILHPLKTGNYTYKAFREENSNEVNCVFLRKPEYFVANELLRVFEEFVSKQWPIISQLELTTSDGKIFANGTEFNNNTKMLIEAYAEDIKLWQEQENQKSETPSTATTSTTTNTDANAASTDKKTEDEAKKESAEDNSTIVNGFKECAKTFASFTKYYSFFWFYWKNKNCFSLKLWLNTSNTSIQNALRSVYLDDCIELRTSAVNLKVNGDSKLTSYTDIDVISSNLKSYLSGFAEQLDAIAKNTNNDIGTTEDESVVEETPEFNRETALPIYMYLKMLWDKWLVAMDMNNHEFMVKNFKDNFIFIDSFYRNISNRFMINCQTLLDCYNNVSAAEDITTFKFISDLVNKHHLMFTGVPDFVSGMVNYGLGGEEEATASMKTIFTPVPYESMNPIDKSNKFIIIYIPRLSEIPSEMNNYTNDSFDIVAEKEYADDTGISNDLPEILLDDYGFEDESMYGLYMDYGYYVPSFGLAYGRQNNHIFKNINLSMETPIITSTVINTLSHIAARGSNNTHRVAYIGQDLYPVFSNYSYICEFEMMGCAQIQPLMYFQLMNVPMWRGTYIIFSVTHTMTPGNMVTRVKAMKLSNRAVPYSNAWFTENPNFDPEALRRLECLDQLASGNIVGSTNLSIQNVDSGGSSGGGDTSGGQYGKGIFSGKSMNEQLAICEVTTGTTGSQVKPLITTVEYKCRVGGSKTCTCKLNKHVAEDFKAIAEEVAQLGWFDFYVSSAWRPGNSAYGHRVGVAVDINPPCNDGTPNPWFNAHLCVNGTEPQAGGKLDHPMKKYRPPKSGYDRTKCIWHFNHPVAQIFRSHGWNWGGQFGDVMHFDLRGQPCASGQNTESRSNGGPCPSAWYC